MTALKALMLLSLALGMTVAVEQQRVEAERSRAAHAALTVTNLAAERDSTRRVADTNKRVALVIGDSLQLVERHVVQVEQRSDALDRALGRERRARYALDARVDSLNSTAKASIAADSQSDVRVATFDIRHAPYTVKARVEMPQPPDSARIELRLVLDPIPIEARVSCTPADANGIRTAAVTASSPPWATIQLGHVEQSPDLCASPALAHAQPTHGRVRFAPLVLGIGVVATRDRSSTWGAFIGTGVRIGN